MEWYQYLIVIGLLVIIAFAIMKSNKKDLKLELNKLVDYHYYCLKLIKHYLQVVLT